MNHLRSLLLVILSAGAVTACTTPAKTKPETDANGEKVEYVKYTPVGSHIPIKIRKDQLPSSDRDTSADQAALENAQRRSANPKSPGGS